MAQTVKGVTTLEIGVEDDPFLIPVSLKKITQSSDVSFDSASPSGSPVAQIYVDIDSGEEVPRAEIQKGIFRSKPKRSNKETWADFAPIAADDLAVIEDATKIESFQIEHFIPLADVPFERATGAYFLAPVEGMTAKPLLLIANALKKTKRAGIFKMVKSSRQHLAVLYEKDGGLIVNTLAWSGDFAAVREAREALASAKVPLSTAEKALAEGLVTALASDADVIDVFEDDLIPLRMDLVERAIRGEKLARPKRRERQQVADDGLEAQLRESLTKSARAGRVVAAV